MLLRNGPVSVKKICVDPDKTLTKRTGVISMGIPITKTDWGCEPRLLINGDPYISITGTFSF
jgi:hypothetical protein